MSQTEFGEPEDLEAMLRRVIREETGLTPVAPAEKWRGGELILRPGRERSHGGAGRQRRAA